MNVRVPNGRDAAQRGQSPRSSTRKPASVLGLPTGRTSLEVYDELARLHESGDADFSQAHTFNLDEFVGLPSSDKRSYCAFMQKHLFTRINLPGRHIHFLNGGARDHERRMREIRARDSRRSVEWICCCSASARMRTSGSTSLRAPCTRAATGRGSRSRTRRANVSLFGGRLDRVPREALTMGIGTMLDARAIVLIATGREKARAIGCDVRGAHLDRAAGVGPAAAPERRSDSGFTCGREASAVGVRRAAVTALSRASGRSAA